MKGERLKAVRRYGEAGVERGFTEVDDAAYERFCEARGLDPRADSCTPSERMAVAAGREIHDGVFVFAGTGLPLVGCVFARNTYAPNSVVVMESGVVGPEIRHLPVSVADPRAALNCSTLVSMADAFGSVAARGYCSVGVLGGAECDRYGNLNSTLVHYDARDAKPDDGKPNDEKSNEGKPYDTARRRVTRLAGSGGGNPIATFADSCIVMLAHERRRFPERCSYLTSPCGARGATGTSEHRRRWGLYRGGSVTVVTTLGILRTDAEGSGELILEAVYPGVKVETVLENTGWALRISPDLRVLDPPTYLELKILRYVVDPTGFYLRRAGR